MLIALHKNATTTPATRLALQQASDTDRELAQHYGIDVDTVVRKWRHRSTVQDASHTVHRLQTTLNAAQEKLVIYLRTQLLLPLDDLLAVVREFIEPSMSRSELDRLLHRRGHSRLPAPPKPDGEHKPFKAYEPSYVHIDVRYRTRTSAAMRLLLSTELPAGCSSPSSSTRRQHQQSLPSIGAQSCTV